MSKKLMEAALGYAERGWKVIPLHSVVGSKCSCRKICCRSAGKPHVSKWKEAATTDPGMIRQWWRTWPDANIGIATGKNSGLVVIGIVGQEGDENFRRLCADHGYTCSTMTAVTPSGRHHYYRHPGWGIRKTLRTIADGVDVRGGVGYVVAPPSVNQSGVASRWEADSRNLEELPPWLFKTLRQAETEVAEAISSPAAPAMVEPEESIPQPVVSIAVARSKPASPATVEAKETIAQRLIRLAGAASLFHNQDREAFASVTEEGRCETWMLNGGDFKNWLTRQYWLETESAPSATAMAEALGVLEAEAKFDGPMFRVYTRIAEHEDTIYIDLADEQRQVVEITPTGWRIITDCPVKFRRPKGMRPLPEPVTGGNLEELRPFVNVAGDEDWMLIVAWLLAALRPHGPYPLAALHGEQGAAKTTTARVLRALVDPNLAPVRSEPRDGRDFIISASNGWVIALDNLSNVSPSLSDALCRASTGGGFATRTLHTNSDETIFDVQRPVILTGIEELTTRGDLLDRSLVISLPRIPSSERKTERDFWADFAMAQPRILGALFTVVAGALHELPHTDLAHLPRLADFAVWIAAAEPSLGWERGSFMKAFIANRHEANNVVLEASLLAGPILQLVAKGTWLGTAEQLLALLNASVPESARRTHDWPKTPRGMSGALRRLAPNLWPLGVRVTFDRHGDRKRTRLIMIDRPAPSAPSTPSAEADSAA